MVVERCRLGRLLVEEMCVGAAVDLVMVTWVGALLWLLCAAETWVGAFV